MIRRPAAVLAVFLAACASTPQFAPLPPPPSSPFPASTYTESPAIASLMKDARAASEAGQPANAAALLERGLVQQVGVAEVIGRPKTYGTTQAFLEYFGLRALEDMPSAEELRRIPITKPEALVTADAGLATAPPEQQELAQEPTPVEPAQAASEPAPEPPSTEERA